METAKDVSNYLLVCLFILQKKVIREEAYNTAAPDK